MKNLSSRATTKNDAIVVFYDDSYKDYVKYENMEDQDELPSKERKYNCL